MTDITIIICSYNRADWLKEAIESLTKLETKDFTYEVLVIDNASTDHTQAVTKEMIKTSSCPIRYVLEKEPGVSFARNRGVQESNTTWIAFVDDDEIAEPDWLIQLLDTAEKENVKCVGGGVHLRLEEDADRELKPWVRLLLGCTETMPYKQYDGKRVPTTGNMLIHTEIFDKIGLFRTDLLEGGEDTDLYQRMSRAGYDAWFTPDALVHHQIPPFRLKEDYLGSTARRMGSHIARSEFERYGYVRFIPVALTRKAFTMLVHAPKRWLAKLSGDKEAILERNSYLWMWQGYFKAARGFMMGDYKSDAKLSFRDEREYAS